MTYSESEKEAILELLFESKLSPEKFVRELGLQIHCHTLENWMKGDNRVEEWRMRRGFIGPEDKLKAIQMYLSHIKPKLIAQKFGIRHVETLRVWARRYQTEGMSFLMKDKASSKRPPGETASKVEPQNEADIGKFSWREIAEQRQMRIKLLEREIELLKKFESSDGLSRTTKNSRSTEVISELKKQDPKLNVREICREFEIGKSTYYRHLRPKPARPDPDLTVLDEFFAADPYAAGKLGHRLVQAKLSVGIGTISPVHIPREKILKYMRAKGYLVQQRKNKLPYHQEVETNNPPVKNLLFRKLKFLGILKIFHFFKPKRPDQTYVSDTTEFRFGKGEKAYLSPLIDLWDNHVLGWSVSRHPDTELILSSLEKASHNMRPTKKSILHTDRGSVYRGQKWEEESKKIGVNPSMSRKGKCEDNAACEAHFGRLKIAIYHHQDWSKLTFEDVKKRIDEYFVWHNTQRPQSKFGGLTPLQMRQKYYGDFKFRMSD
jgi:transposase InsO family protein/transposase-like protein